MTRSQLDRDRKSQQEQTVERLSNNPTIGEVKQVYEHIGNSDNSNFEADVQIEAGTNQEQRCPIEFSGAIDIPEAGDKVILSYREGGNKPYITGVAYSSSDRPPVGMAGIYRREFESNDSPAGPGNLYISGNTKYAEGSSATVDSDNMTPERSVVRIAKRKNEIADPTQEADVPAKIEFYDSPFEKGFSESYITVSMNNVKDGDSYKQTDATWGMKFDMSDGTFQLVDPKGFGIESHGDGSFTWHVKQGEGNMDFKEHTTDTGPLNL